MRRLLGFALCAMFAAAQTVKYEPERERWQQTAELFRAMGVAPGSVVADVGASTGFLSVRLSPLVGEQGRVYAEDISESRLDFLRKRLASARLNNVVVVQGSADDPRLPVEALDAVVILNAYHEMPKYDDMLRHIRGALKPSGRLVIAEPSAAPDEATRAQQIAKHHIDLTFVGEEMTAAGFTVVESRKDFAHIPDAGTYSMVVRRRAE
jgi:ubiquinone/menaquinone biosynthesis C-methylase UbiE